MTKRSYFSDGMVDVYKGRRNVTAGWQITWPDGTKHSGHSIDRIRAEKTARNTIRQVGGYAVYGNPNRRTFAHVIAAREKFAREQGFANYRAWYDNMTRQRDEYEAACSIEIVEVT